MKQEVSDELLSAYIDSELSCQDKHDIAEQIRINPALATRVKQLTELKLAVKSAYKQIPEVPQSGVTRCAEKIRHLNTYCFRAIAAAIMLTIGLVIGYSIDNNSDSLNSVAQNDAQQTLYGIRLQPVAQDTSKLLLHITSSELDKLDEVLDRAEQILNKYQQQNKKLQLEVVANSNGINLLRSATTPYQKRIKNLRLTHDNIKFVACKNTLKKLLKEGKNISVVDGTQTDTPALDKIIQRINQGWTYVKI